MTSVSRLEWVIAAALVCAGVVLFSLTFLLGTPADEEEFRFAVLAAWLRVHAMADGGFPFWTSELGFGVPQPFVPHFGLHPLAPLLALLSPAAWARALLFVQVALGAIGMWLLGTHLNLRPAVRALCALTHLLAAPTQNYVLSDFWPSHHVVWVSAPWVLWLAWRILEDRPAHPRRAGLALGLVTGLAAASTNPGHLLVYVALALAVALIHWRAMLRHAAAFAIAVATTAAILAPAVVQVASERPLFPTEALSNVPDPLPPADAIQPLLPDGSRGTRTLFIGAPIAVVAALGCVWPRAARLDLIVGLVLSSLMLFTSWIPALFVSARYQFRDPVTLTAILLAGLAAHALWERPVGRWLGPAIVALQVAALASAVNPLVTRTLDRAGRQGLSFSGATGDTPLATRIAGTVRRSDRLLYSPKIDDAVAERAFVQDGLGINSLAYQRVAVVNGTFKAVSTDRWWPNDRLFYGWIRTPRQLVETDTALDVLGLGYVLALADEPVAPGLRPLWSQRTVRGAELVMFENADAWPGAFLVEPADANRQLATHPGCGHDRVLCLDIGQLAAVGDARVTVTRGTNQIGVAFAPVARQRVLVVTEMQREAWTARAGDERLPIATVYGGMMGVPVPPGATAIELQYLPAPMLMATVLSYGTALMAITVLVVTRRGRAAEPIAPRPIGRS